MNMQIYTPSARFDNQARALTEDELRTMAPSIFATTAHESRSERFAPIPTIEVIRGLAKEGFSVVGARQSVARLDDRREFTKHLLRLRRLDDAVKYQVGDTVFEMLLKNANDGTSVYDLLAGLFRICCLNSVVAATAMLDALKVRHTGDVQQRVIEGTFSVLKSAEIALAAPQDWSKIELKPEERVAFAESAHVLRFADGEGNVATPVKPLQLLEARRADDTKRDLWTTFNVVQENAIKGGLTAWGQNAAGQRRRSTTREIKGIDQDVKLNKALWMLADKMAKLKAPAIAA